VQTTEGKPHLSAGIDSTRNFSGTQIAAKAARRTAWAFLQHMLEALPIRAGVPTPARPRASWALLHVPVFPTSSAAIKRVPVITTAGPLFKSFASYKVPVRGVILTVALQDENLPPGVWGRSP
jgi:hypothetical protein